MLHRVRRIAGLGCGLALWAAVLLAEGRAQSVVLPSGGEKELDTAYTRDQRDAFKKMIRGEQDPADQDAAIGNAAKWYSYQATWPRFQNQAGGMHDLLKKFENEVVGDALKYKAVNDKFMQKFTKQMIARLKEVLQNDLTIARVNGADVLGRLAGTGQEEVADALVEVLNDDKQNRAVKYHAVRGLERLFAVGPLKDKDRPTKCILALLKFLDTKPTFSADASAEEVDAFRWVRRATVAALGQTRSPGVQVEGKLEGRTALALLHILNNDGVNPSSRVDEQLEAAVAVASLKCQLTKGYQPDYAAEQIGRFVVELTGQYQTERDRYQAERDHRPWKIYSARLGDALEAMKADAAKAESKDAVAYVAGVANQCLVLLKVIDQGKDALMPQDNLQKWLEANAAKSTTVYAGVEDSKVKPFQRGEPELKEKTTDTDK